VKGASCDSSWMCSIRCWAWRSARWFCTGASTRTVSPRLGAAIREDRTSHRLGEVYLAACRQRRGGQCGQDAAGRTREAVPRLRDRREHHHRHRRTESEKCIWLHAVSVGEVNAAKTLLAELEKQFRDFEIVVSTTTDTGFARASKLRSISRGWCGAPSGGSIRPSVCSWSLRSGRISSSRPAGAMSPSWSSTGESATRASRNTGESGGSRGFSSAKSTWCWPKPKNTRTGSDSWAALPNAWW